MNGRVRYWFGILAWAIIVIVALAVLFGCDQRMQTQVATRYQVNIDQVSWCFDQGGNSSVYPCKWDSRERAVTGWDRSVPPVALYVRASIGCPLPVPRYVSCYWAPQDQ